MWYLQPSALVFYPHEGHVAHPTSSVCTQILHIPWLGPTSCRVCLQTRFHVTDAQEKCNALLCTVPVPRQRCRLQGAAPVLLHIGHALHGRVQLLRPGCQLRRLRVPQPRTPQRLPSPRPKPVKTCPARPTREGQGGLLRRLRVPKPQPPLCLPSPPGFLGLKLVLSDPAWKAAAPRASP